MSQLFASGGQSIGFSFNISPSNEHPGLISFSMDWLDLLAVQGTLKSLLQHHSSKASILLCSAFFIVQLLHPYMTTGKTRALTRRTFVGKVMSLLFNMLSRLLITFLIRSKRLLISWLQSPSAVILEPPKIKSATVSWPWVCIKIQWDDCSECKLQSLVHIRSKFQHSHPKIIMSSLGFYKLNDLQHSGLCWCSVTKSYPTLHDPVDCSTPGFLVPHYLLEFAQVHVHCISDTIQPSHPLSPSSPSIFPSFRVFSNELAICISYSKYWSISFGISPSNEYSGLICLKTDWFDFLVVQGILKSLFQHHSAEASSVWRSAFFMVQLSHPYMTMGKTIALTRWPFVGKVMSLLFNMLSRLVIAFLPRCKHLLMSWLQSSSARILES